MIFHDVSDLGDRGRPGRAELMDHQRGGGHGELHRLAQARPGGQRRGQIGGDGIAGADDIDRPADGQRRDVLGAVARRRADDAVDRPC